MRTETLAKSALAVTLAAAGFAFGSRAFGPRVEPRRQESQLHSNPVEVRAKLERIGRAIVLYRQDFPAKPVSEWEDFADAGLPAAPWALTIPGHQWTISEEDLHYAPGLYSGGERFRTDFALLYRDSLAMNKDRWQAGGTRQIILFDPLHAEARSIVKAGLNRRTLVLRWDGTVEEVTFRLAPPAGLGELAGK
jgi:hypothetical protein